MVPRHKTDEPEAADVIQSDARVSAGERRTKDVVVAGTGFELPISFRAKTYILTKAGASRGIAGSISFKPSQRQIWASSVE